PPRLHSFPTRRSSDLVSVTMRVVDSVLDMLALRPARLAPERQEHQPPRIEAGQQGGESTDPERRAAHLRATGEGRLQNRVLRIEDRKSTRLNSSHVKI